jgi:hypothetical protein
MGSFVGSPWSGAKWDRGEKQIFATWAGLQAIPMVMVGLLGR